MPERPIFFNRLVLPVAWEPLDRAVSTELREATDRVNGGVFEFLLHNIDVQAAARPADDKLAEALAPLATKLDIALAMLRRLAYRDVRLPPAAAIDLGLTRMAWHSQTPLRVDDWLRITIYFDLTFLEPVTLYGRVSYCVADADGGCSVQAELAEISHSTGEALTRLAFLAQRREVASRTHRWE